MRVQLLQQSKSIHKHTYTYYSINTSTLYTAVRPIQVLSNNLIKLVKYNDEFWL